MQHAAQFQIFCTAKIFSAYLFCVNVLLRDSKLFKGIELSRQVLVFRRYMRLSAAECRTPFFEYSIAKKRAVENKKVNKKTGIRKVHKFEIFINLKRIYTVFLYRF